MRTKVLFIWIVVLLGLCNQNVNGSGIEHIIVIMLENRSFDHVLGYLTAQNHRNDMNGLTGTESNPFNPLDPNSPVVFVTNNASQVTDIDPPHSVRSTSLQIFGIDDPTDGFDRTTTPPMNGFVQAAEKRQMGTGPNALECFDPTQVPVMTALANEFAVFDAWFSSVPGPTQVNRMFLHAASSNGEINNNVDQMVAGYPQKTIFNSLNDKNIPWKVYIDPITTLLVFQQLRYPKDLARLRDYKWFAADVRAGKLAKYVVIEPGFYTWGDSHPATDQHPGHDMAQGERLIKDIYETVRGSKYWHKTAILITYDEHGGYYDHVAPPMQGVPNPDGRVANGTVTFNFDRLGVRVPTILISSRVKKGSVVHAPTSGAWEHSSVPATVKKMFGLPNFLNARDAWAATFEGLFDQTPREDCPRTLPDPIPYSGPAYRPDNPLSDLQQDLCTLAGGLNMWFPVAQTSVSRLRGETDAFYFARTNINTYIGRKTRGMNILN